MLVAAQIMTGLLALIHIYILVLESFLWSRAVKVFAIPKALREEEILKTMLKNQGAYNGILAAGLIWSLMHPDPAVGMQLSLFFLGAIAFAGIVGAVTAKVQILFIQTIPATLAIALWLLA